MESDLQDALIAWQGGELPPGRADALLARLREDAEFRRAFAAEAWTLSLSRIAHAPAPDFDGNHRPTDAHDYVWRCKCTSFEIHLFCPAPEDSMTRSAMIRARVEPELKSRAEATLEQLGLSPTSAITLFYRQIVQHRGLPFDVRLPNATTRRAIDDAREGRVVEADSVNELFSKLDAPVRRGSRTTRKRQVRSKR